VGARPEGVKGGCVCADVLDVISAALLPSRVARLLDEDETVQVMVDASNPGGQSLPLYHWLVVTDRRLLVASHSRWSLDARMGRSIMLSRVLGATMCSPSSSMARARFAVLDRRDLEVEVPIADQEQLANLVRAVNAAAAQHSTMFTATGAPG
jgi:hypothetical protein